jgi:hypothetical protein
VECVAWKIGSWGVVHAKQKHTATKRIQGSACPKSKATDNFLSVGYATLQVY